MSRPSVDTAARAIGPMTALAVLVSNMIGTGVFTSLGLQVVELHSGLALLGLWALGGLLALCGALSYAELGAALPESGGEFVYLSRAFHPLIGFLGGWVSMTAGFAAPVALAGIAFGKYAAVLLPLGASAGTALVLALVALVHLSDLRLARGFQVAVTATKLCLIVAFIVAGLFVGPHLPLPQTLVAESWREVFSPAFAISLVYVSYSYTGWNAVGYIAGEVRDPQRVIPRTVLLGVALVTTLYMALNWTFLRTVPLADLSGKVEVGALSAAQMVGAAGGRLMSGVIALLLVATISALVLAGSRVTQSVCASLPALAGLGRRAADGVPRNALLLQFALIALLIVTGSFEQVLAYTGFTLNLMSMLAVIGLYRLRLREPQLVRPYRTFGYPITPLVFIALSLWMQIFVLRQRPLVVLASAATLALGTLVYKLAGGGTPVAAPAPGSTQGTL